MTTQTDCVFSSSAFKRRVPLALSAVLISPLLLLIHNPSASPPLHHPLCITPSASHPFCQDADKKSHEQDKALVESAMEVKELRAALSEQNMAAATLKVADVSGGERRRPDTSLAVDAATTIAALLLLCCCGRGYGR